MYHRVLSACLSLVAALLLAVPCVHAQNDEPGAPAAPNAPTGSEPQKTNSPSPEDARAQARTAADAAGKVEEAVSNSRERRLKVAGSQKAITSITSLEPDHSQDPLEDLRRIEAAVKALQQPNPDLITALKNAQTSIPSLDAARKTACDELQKFEGVVPEVSAAQTKCTAAENHAAEERKALAAALTGIQDALRSIAPYAEKQVQTFTVKLKPLSDLQPSDTKPDALQILRSLPAGLPALKQVLTNKTDYKATWSRIADMLQKLGPGTGSQGGSDATGGSVDKGLADCQAAVDQILPNLDSWFQILGTYASTSAKALDTMISDVEIDPARNSAAALGAVHDKSAAVTGLQSTVDAWPPLVAYLVDGNPAKFDLNTAKRDFDDLSGATNSLRAAVSRLSDALAGDFSNFETDQVRLYYFTDVPRLMYALNSSVRTMGGVAEAQEQAAAQRKKLSEAEFELADAQASVNRYQKQVLDLQEQQRQIQVKLKGQDARVKKLGSQLNHAQGEKDEAAADYQKAQSVPDDPSKASAIDKAKAKDDAAAGKLSQTQSDYNSAKSERDTTQSQLDSSKNDSDGLPARIAEAKEALSSAQTAVSEQRRKMLMTAQAESDAFAFARDNTPFLFAQAVGSSTDPAKRVLLYAFNDSKIIFMRGMREDLNKVKRIIAEFDQPAPQARLTLWTFQLNADSAQKTNEKAADKLNHSMEIIDEELSETRALENTTLSLLRDFINQVVRRCANQHVYVEVGPVTTTRWAVLCTAPATQANCPTCGPADLEKLGRLSFYDPLVFKQLNFDIDHVNLNALRKLIPDPAGTTTLGEALLILSLAPLGTRLAIRDQFESAIQARLRALPLSPKLDKCAWLHPDPQSADTKICSKSKLKVAGTRPSGESTLPLTWHALGIWEQGIAGSGVGLTSSQLEISRALRAHYDASYLHSIADTLGSWINGLGEINVRDSKLQQDMAALEDRGKALLPPKDSDRLSKLQQQGRSLNETETAEKNQLIQKGINSLSAVDRSTYDQDSLEQLKLEARRQTIRQESVRIVNELQSYGIDVGDLVSQFGAAGSDTDRMKVLAEVLESFKPVLSGALSTATPRQAAADEMLKEMIIALEDDLDRLFVQPMIRGLRKRLTAETGVRVGILQRESMLATNRGKARIDPRASAQLAVGEEQDILTGIQQLGQLYTAVQSGGAFAALGALQSHPREPQPEIYALTTGNRFEVTPIFDPSGQALRFKFDFVSTSNLQEPNGSTNPQMPRIERHTINTEVQLSNLETREISRFESNARLGLATQYWGGIPVLKDIPYVRPWIPLVGWFVRKGGSNGSAQQSVIFGQTTIYPTIDDMVTLLEDAGSNASP